MPGKHSDDAPGRISQYLQYMYFLRFSLLSWCLLLALWLTDDYGYTTSITRAFVAPNSSWQAFHISFFAICFQFVTLITARNVCTNGQARFGTPLPRGLSWLFCDGRTGPMMVSLFLAQVPAISMMLYVAHTVKKEGEIHFGFGHLGANWIWADFLLGTGAALLFWYMVSLFYFWTYTEPVHEMVSQEARPLIYPRWMFGDLQKAPRPWIAVLLEKPLRLLVSFTYHGFAYDRGGALWELHFLSFVSLLGFLLLYVFLYPLTAPIRRDRDLLTGCIVAVLLAAGFIAGILFRPKSQTEPDECTWLRWVRPLFVVFAIFVAGLFIRAAYVFHTADNMERSLPVLATLLIIASFGLWAMSGLAFVLDRYRVPVLTSAAVLLFFPKFVHLTYGEHYFNVKPRAEAAQLPPSPAQALQLRERPSNEPLIVITTTGGGIHAAVWTAEILGKLEESFAKDRQLQTAGANGSAYKFHDHILLASGVSGGSVGLMSYLLEYTAADPFAKPELSTQRMRGATSCSSIEDVAWGLEYYDLVRFALNFWWSSKTQDPPDRNWALSQAFSRNLSDRLCGTDAEHLSGIPALKETGNSFTLGQGVDRLRARTMPAFTLNTTAVETGGRFLLANYQIPSNGDADSDLLPSESFLHAYGEPCERKRTEGYADLPIAVAARLSATFPFVSSASRVPVKYAKLAHHFVDGGYYDNDGTGSAIEFLQWALAPPNGRKDDPCVLTLTESGDGQTVQAKPLVKMRRPILLVEIRNGDDLNPLTNVDGIVFQEHPKNTHPWNALSQVGAPLEALWGAGHESITRRNRLGLCLLEKSMSDQMAVHHIVFNYDPALSKPVSRDKSDKDKSDIVQPLNWHLTELEKSEIDEKAADSATEETLSDATAWVKRILQAKTPEQLASVDAPCKIAHVRVGPKE